MEKREFINIHCHGLFGVDDGAKDLDESMRMIEKARSEDIKKIIYTFHYTPGDDEEILARAKENLEVIKEETSRKYGDMEFFLGNEIYCPDGLGNTIIEGLREGRILTLAGSSYVLIEMAFSSRYDQIFKTASNLVQHGYRPIIAHVERYNSLFRNDEGIGQLISLGAYIQVNGRSFMGGIFDKRAKWVTRLVENGRVHFIADDSHDDRERCPIMGSVNDKLDEKVRSKVLERVFHYNPERVLADKYI